MKKLMAMITILFLPLTACTLATGKPIISGNGNGYGNIGNGDINITLQNITDKVKAFSLRSENEQRITIYKKLLIDDIRDTLVFNTVRDNVDMWAGSMIEKLLSGNAAQFKKLQIKYPKNQCNNWVKHAGILDENCKLFFKYEDSIFKTYNEANK